MRIAVNRPGNLDGDVSIAVLAADGISLDDIKKWGGQVVRAASQEMTSLMLDRRLDVVSFGISINHPRIREMANGLDLVMLPISTEARQEGRRRHGRKPCKIKAGEYKFLAADTSSICVGLTRSCAPIWTRSSPTTSPKASSTISTSTKRRIGC